MKSKRLYYINRVSEYVMQTPSLGLKIEEIAASIGVTKKTLYNYFDSKQQLLECVLDSYLKAHVESIRKRCSESSSPIAALVQLGRLVCAMHKGYKAHPAVCLGVVDEEVASRIFSDRRADIQQLVTLIFRRGGRAGLFDGDVDAELAASIFLSALEMVAVSGRSIVEGELGYNRLVLYVLRGYCTIRGVAVLREMLDVRVVAS